MTQHDEKGLMDKQIPEVTPEETRSARISVAEAAIKGGWTDQLVEVLDALGLTERATA